MDQLGGFARHAGKLVQTGQGVFKEGPHIDYVLLVVQAEQPESVVSASSTRAKRPPQPDGIHPRQPVGLRPSINLELPLDALQPSAQPKGFQHRTEIDMEAVCKDPFKHGKSTLQHRYVESAAEKRHETVELLAFESEPGKVLVLRPIPSG